MKTVEDQAAKKFWTYTTYLVFTVLALILLSSRFPGGISHENMAIFLLSFVFLVIKILAKLEAKLENITRMLNDSGMNRRSD